MAREKRQQRTPPNAPTNPADEGAPGTPGTGEDLCPACDGSGTRSGKPCPDCGGTGRITEGIGGG